MNVSMFNLDARHCSMAKSYQMNIVTLSGCCKNIQAWCWNGWEYNQLLWIQEPNPVQIDTSKQKSSVKGKKSSIGRLKPVSKRVLIGWWITSSQNETKCHTHAQAQNLSIESEYDLRHIHLEKFRTFWLKECTQGLKTPQLYGLNL